VNEEMESGQRAGVSSATWRRVTAVAEMMASRSRYSFET
jgi:hypothetical protein